MRIPVGATASIYPASATEARDFPRVEGAGSSPARGIAYPHSPVVERNKTPGYEPGGWRFNSLRGCCPRRQAGKATACKAVIVGSSPTEDSVLDPSSAGERRPDMPEDVGSSPTGPTRRDGSIARASEHARIPGP